MQFPIETTIAPETYGKLTANTLRIDGNAGQIPTSFQFAVVARSVTDGVTTDTLCAQNVSPMTTDQWASWKDQEDADYILACVATNEGLVLA